MSTESSPEDGLCRGGHDGRHGPAGSAGGHPPGDPHYGSGRQGHEGQGAPAGLCQGAATLQVAKAQSLEQAMQNRRNAGQ